MAQKLGIPLPKATYSSPAEARDAKLRAQLLDTQERAAAFFQECLKRPEGARAREYLAGRGLNEETIARFRIGYAPDSGFLLRDRLAGEFSEEVLRESGLFSWKQEDVPRPRPSALWTDRTALSESRRVGDPDPRRISARSPKPEARSPNVFQIPQPRNVPHRQRRGKNHRLHRTHPGHRRKVRSKVFEFPETGIYSKGRVLFNLDQAKEAIRKLDYAILVEGQMDCISVYAAGFHNVIASSGTAFTEIQAKLLGRFSKNVVVNFDPDTAGAKATERTLGLLVEEEFQIKVLTLEQGFDPDLYIRRKGKDAYGEACAVRKNISTI